MRRANAQLQSDRRAEILAAAQRCFVRSGFHGASMQDICAEAGMSPGNLYRYFPSKEALIAGIAERDRAEVGAAVRAAPTSRTACSPCSRAWRTTISPSGRDEQVQLCTEIMAEARRNPEIARISAAFDADVRKWLIDLLRAAAERGDIPGDIDFDGVVTMLMVIADGVWWRRALDPDFDAEAVLPIFMDITRHMLRGGSPKPPTSQRAFDTRRALDESEPHHRRRPRRRRRALDRVRAFPAARDRRKAAPPFAAGEGEAKKLFRVAVVETNVVPHSRKLIAVRPHRGRQAGHHHRAHRRHADRAAGQARHAGSRRATSSPSCPTRRARRRWRRREALVDADAGPSSTPSAR